MDFYAPISVYNSASNSRSGHTMSLAAFMSLGKKYKEVITEYRKSKQGIASLKEQLSELKSQLAEAEETVSIGYNPLLDRIPDEYTLAQSLLQSLPGSISALEAEIKSQSIACDRIKRSRIPAATLSGTFEPRRVEKDLQQHSGFICVDIDDHFTSKGKDGTERVYAQSLDGILDIVSKLPWVCYAARSVGGAGFYLLIPLGPIDDVHTHRWYFECLEEEFSQYGFVIDPACSDVTRLRVLSYDEHPYRNFKCVPYMGRANFIGKAERKRIEDEARRKELQQRLRSQRFDNSIDDDMRHVSMCIDKMLSRRISGIADGYKDWVAVGMSLANAFGEQGRDMFHAISSTSTKYNSSDVDKAFSGFISHRDGRSTIATLFQMFDKVGIHWYDKS